MILDLSLSQVILASVTSLIGPFLVLLLIRYFEKKRFQKERQLDIFRTLVKRPFTTHALVLDH